mmetsp:Transcript_5999/g.6555  ORF Transcript_5999/g.6555 Transcript_5999/m.6555 type:complete len:229 (+) Transcript_5999:29-715(+)
MFRFLLVLCVIGLVAGQDVRGLLVGEWDLEISKTSKSEEYATEGDVVRVFMNVTNDAGDLKAEYTDFENDLEYAINMEFESNSNGAVYYADIADDAEADLKKLFSFDFFNRSKGAMVSQGAFESDLAGTPGTYTMYITSPISLTVSIHNAEGIVSVAAIKRVYKPPQTFWSKYGMAIMMGLAIMVPRLIQNFAGVGGQAAPQGQGQAQGGARGNVRRDGPRIEEIKEE